MNGDQRAGLAPQTPRARQLSRLFLLLLGAAALYLIWTIARPFLTSILAAALLATAIFPLYERLRRSVRQPSLAAALVTLIVLIAVLVPTVLVIGRVAHEITGVYNWLNEQQSNEGGWSEFVKRLVDPPVNWVAEKSGVSREQLRQEALDRLRIAGTAMLGWARSLALNIGQTLLNLVTILMTLFFLLRDGERIRDRIGALLPMEPHRYRQLVSTIAASVTANVDGVILVAVAQGILGAIGYAIAGLSSIILWSAATAIFSIVPMAGSALVWGTACIYLAAAGSWGKALFMLVWGAGIVSTADNIVRPLVLSGKVKLNTLLIFFSLLGGAEAFGVLGLFLGPVIVSAAIAVLKMIEEERAEWESGGRLLDAGDGNG